MVGLGLLPVPQIDKMSRWQVVDRVRELSTKAVKSGGDGCKWRVGVEV